MDAELQQFISMIEPVDGDFARSYEEKLAVSGRADTVLCHLAGRPHDPLQRSCCRTGSCT